jgi:hypothetical protein
MADVLGDPDLLKYICDWLPVRPHGLRARAVARAWRLATTRSLDADEMGERVAKTHERMRQYLEFMRGKINEPLRHYLTNEPYPADRALLWDGAGLPRRTGPTMCPETGVDWCANLGRVIRDREKPTYTVWNPPTWWPGRLAGHANIYVASTPCM